MTNKDTFIGTCEWCGEPDVLLVVNDDLPEWTEGVACKRCEESMMEEVERQREIELDRLDSLMDYGE